MGILKSSQGDEKSDPNEPRATDGQDSQVWWVDADGEALWGGVLDDDGLDTLIASEPEPQASEGEETAHSEEGTPPSTSNGHLPTDGHVAEDSEIDDLALVVSRPQEPGSPEFRILCGAKTAAETRRRFSWKTDKELAEAYDIALDERGRAEADGDQVEVVYWAALVEASLKEAMSRASFGDLPHWEESEDRREQRETLKRMDALARAREDLLREDASI